MAKYNIVISGYYGFDNAGDEAMLYSILRSLRALYPDAEITVISGHPEKTAEVFGTKAVPRFGGWSIFKSLLRANLLISGGGSLLQDVTSSRSLLYYLSIIGAGIVLRKKVVLYGQGIGPLHRKWVCALLGKILSHADAITVRDEKSSLFLKKLGVSAPVYTTADSVLALPRVGLEEGREILRAAGLTEGKKWIGISVRNWLEAEQWIAEFGSYVRRLLQEPVEIVFIAMQYPDDQKTAESICRGLPGERIHFLQQSFTAPQLMSIIGNLDLLVGMRLHALIFAALMHVPLIGISYDPKIDNFLAAIGKKSAFPISAFEAETLYNKTVETMQEQRSAGDWEAVDALRRKAEETAQILKKVVRRC